MYCGRQPAITALMAMFSTVASAHRGGTTAMTSDARRPEPATIARTRSAVGRTNGSPSVSRRAWNVSMASSSSAKVKRSGSSTRGSTCRSVSRDVAGQSVNHLWQGVFGPLVNDRRATRRRSGA